MFVCARCATLVALCIGCYRNHRYCADCAVLARADSRKRARQTYARSEEGRLGNADRQRAYRQRKREQQRVTDHTSAPDPGPENLLSPDGNHPPAQEDPHEDDSKAPPTGDQPAPTPPVVPTPLRCCACCGRPIVWFLPPGARRPPRRRPRR